MFGLLDNNFYSYIAIYHQSTVGSKAPIHTSCRSESSQFFFQRICYNVNIHTLRTLDRVRSHARRVLLSDRHYIWEQALLIFRLLFRVSDISEIYLSTLRSLKLILSTTQYMCWHVQSHRATEMCHKFLISL